MSEIRTLKDGETQIAPRTVAKAVSTAAGKTVEAALGEAAAQIATMQKLKRNNIMGVYPVKTGQTIHAGDVVDVVGGEVGKTWRAEANVENVAEGAAASETVVRRLSEQYSVLALYNTSNQRCDAILVRNSDGKAVDGARTAFYSSAASNLSLDRLSDTKFVVGYSSGGGIRFSRIGTVSGASITFGSEYTLNANANSQNVLESLSETSFLSVYNSSGLKAKVFPVSGTAITTNATTESALPGNTSASYISKTRLPDLNGNKRACVCFSDGSDGNKGKSVIATIKPDNTVEWGSVVTFNAGSTTSTACCTDGNDAIVSYVSSDGVYSKVLSVTGATINPNNPYEKLSTGVYTNAISLGNVGGKIIGTVVQGAMVLKRDGNTLSKALYYNFNSALTYNTSLAPISLNQFLLAYPDADNSNYGTATILTVRGDQIAGSFTDTSSDCIALQDATSGQQCEVIFDGVAELPGFTAGTEISSPGVYGYCPEDGRVWVRPEWDGGVVTGSYFGNGSTSQNKITLGFRPKAVMIAGKSLNDSDQNTLMAFLVGKSNIGSGDGFSITDDGFSVKTLGSSYPPQVNASGKTYDFIAFK